MRAPKSKTSRLPHLSWFNLGFLTVWWTLINFVAEATAFTTFGLYLPQHPFLLPTLGLLMWSLAKKKRWPILLNGATLLIFGALLLGVHLPWSRLAPADPDATRVRVMTWNALLLRAGTDKIASEIRAQNPDIVCLQETLGGRGVPNDRTPELLARFPDWHAERAGDVTILSRWPLKNKREYRHPRPSHRRVLAATCQTPDGPIDVIAAHISTAAQGSRYGGRKPRSLRRLLETAELVQQTAQTRQKQLPTVDKALDESKRSARPYLLMGDFNNPPRGRFHRHLKARLTDAFAQGGLGNGFSFPARLPVMRIDYIWLGRAMRARRAYTVATGASDHLAVVADLEVSFT